MKEYLYEDLVKSIEEMRKLVNTEVSVEIIKNTRTNQFECVNGYLKTIDPVSHTLIILPKDNNKKKCLKLIPNHAVKKITALDNKISESDLKLYENFIHTKAHSTSTDELKKTKENIVRLVEKNRFPVKLDALDGSIIVGDICKIKSPFREQDIECSNYKVSSNLKELLKDVLSTD